MTRSLSDTPIAADDRGLAYGDGLFETVLVRDGEPQLWPQHMARLARGCRALGIPMPAAAELDGLPGQAGAGLMVLKLIVTRGSGGRGYLPPSPAEPRLLWQLSRFAPQVERWEAGVRVRHCRLQLGIQPALAGLKHLNRLENVLARSEWDDPEVAEGLLCDSQGSLVEATCMNLFWQRRGRLETPRLDGSGVAGTLRAALMERLPITEVVAGPEVLAEAEAVWLGNSLQGLWPVIRLDTADGAMQRCWTLAGLRRDIQREAHELLGYPAEFGH
ncbi:aminodeoxychorismate lyase [Halomonas sp. MCCC 1A17488]|uniref:Aminodeoxychorismate lyase n=1 Tax=Billgrantia sulfidoxydans TaxID=2733484 RepID=A0ABX7W4N4_9GAMM|nr:MULTISPECIES: aminodeoxychorismate lyase [Halomonas]MCE8015660.1 aminodeoxychorismate lyase [Halomonas sp. MCCC 1A17488]MCG3238993.1 aminodeoxychorismate lyase [Halomonas sp. MCCC 1A17488]QPP51055.1 aminodeoxychorismate lyase [Halomonas sp. SS10-MC5]QTP54567.1 aminodeoxychorismate lyase [Halomonas sulfidoxydans]